MRFWTAVALVILTAETVAILRSEDGKDAGTISHFVRRVAHTHHPAGKVAFLVGLGTGSAWCAVHILEHPDARPAPR